MYFHVCYVERLITLSYLKKHNDREQGSSWSGTLKKCFIQLTSASWDQHYLVKYKQLRELIELLKFDCSLKNMSSASGRLWLSDISLSCGVQDWCLCTSNWREKNNKRKGLDKKYLILNKFDFKMLKLCALTNSEFHVCVLIYFNLLSCNRKSDLPNH